MKTSLVLCNIDLISYKKKHWLINYLVYLIITKNYPGVGKVMFLKKVSYAHQGYIDYIIYNLFL